MGEISWRGPDVGRKVCEDSSSTLKWAVMVVSLVVFVSGSRFPSMPDGLVAVVDQGSGSTTWICLLELGVSVDRCLSSSSGGNGVSVGLFNVLLVFSRLFSLLRGLADLSWEIEVSAHRDT